MQNSGRRDPHTREYWEKSALILILLVYYIGVYFSILKITAPLEHYTLFSSWDLAIPLVPSFIYFYLQIYFVVLIPSLVNENLTTYRRYFMAYILNMSITYVIFFLYPTTIPRPPISMDTFNQFGLMILYRFDIPMGCFPSLHVSMAALSALTVYHENRNLGLIVHAIAAMIGLSTVFLQQHYIVDVVGGYAMAGFSYGVVFHKEIAKSLIAKFSLVR